MWRKKRYAEYYKRVKAENDIWYGFMPTEKLKKSLAEMMYETGVSIRNSLSSIFDIT